MIKLPLFVLQDKACDICGDTGFAVSIITCFVCKRTSEHIYCMQVPLSFIPVAWVCNECSKTRQADAKVKASYGKQEIVQNSVSKTSTPLRRNLPPEGAKVKLIPVEEAILLSSHAKSRASDTRSTSCRILSAHAKASTLSTVGSSGAMPNPGNRRRIYNSQGSRHVQFHQTVNSSLDLTPSSRRTTWGLPSSEGLKVLQQHKRPDERKVQNHSACITSKREISADEKWKIMVEESLERTSKSFSMTNGIAGSIPKFEESEFDNLPLPIVNEGKSTCSNALGKRSYSESTDQKLTLLMHADVKLETDLLPKACWDLFLFRGIFQICDTDFSVCCEIQAYFPHQVSYKVYEKQKQMPRELKFNVKLHTSVWPKIFLLDPPNSDDIGLYFCPSDLQRSKEKYTHLLEYIDSHNAALQCLMDDAEIIVCSSKHLTAGSRRSASQMYLWGFFLQVKHRKPCQNMEPQIPSAVHGATKGRESCHQSNAVPTLGVSPGFPKQILRYAEHEEKPVGMSTQEKVISSLASQFPPGVSTCPSSTKGSSLLKYPSSIHPAESR
ncbi:PHD finger-containing protein 1-like isoform X4 [Typha angustifolia]|uniref:PHD finger-containing protein 1-like isoform X4 n=1 Tax=Typha angustifolia TaxID=59011 RepID=UPI003C2DFCB6